MVEGVSTFASLHLDVVRSATEELIASANLPLILSGVEDMYRQLNLRPSAGDSTGGGASHTGEPPNSPDALSNGKNVVFIHGFNESPSDGRSNVAETFKRLYWSGSRAKYTGVLWRGDMGRTHYHASVINAFATAPAFAQYLSTLKGEVNVMAFSLGNMVVSSAIQDYDAHPDKYFMLHAAMAREAYDAGQTDPDMRQSEWRNYTSRLYASEWHSLFPSNDGRSGLKWRGRFASVVGPQLYNYYSSGDEVLDNLAEGGANINVLLAVLNPLGRYAWCMQELWKGRQPDWIGGSLYGGWDFNLKYLVPDRTNSENVVTFKLLPPDSAALIPPDQLKTNTFFNNLTPVPLVCKEPDNPIGEGSKFATANRGTLLAEMIPALSFASGRNPVASLSASHNINMQHLVENGQVIDQGFQNGWPVERVNDSDKRERWLHGDYRTVAFYYVYQLFDDIVKTKGHFN